MYAIVVDWEVIFAGRRTRCGAKIAFVAVLIFVIRPRPANAGP